MKKALALMAVGMLAASAASADVSYDFDTNQSASMVSVVRSSDNDVSVNYQYDYSTHVQTDGTQVAIGSAPNSVGGTTTGMRLNVNVATAAVDTDAIIVYPNTGGALGDDWTITFDAWNNHNGDAGGGTGSTNFMIFGATNANTVGVRSTAALSEPGDGFFFNMTGEGGAAQDYRFYSGSGTIERNDAGVSYFGQAAGTELEGASASWQAFFTTPPFQTTGAPSKAWITIQMVKTGTTVTYSVKRPGDASFTQVGTATVPQTANVPFVGMSDVNAGIASPVSDQFVVIDNLSITTPSAVESWSLYTY